MALGKSVYSLIFDSNAAETLIPTRKELAAAKAIMEETTPAIEKYGMAVSKVDRLLAHGLISQDAYNKTVAALDDDLQRAENGLDDIGASNAMATSSFAGMVPVIDPVSLSIRALTGAFDILKSAATTAIDQLGQAFDEIQTIGNTAQSLGIGVREFQNLQFAANQADVPIEKLTKGMYEMEKSISKAVGGSKGEAKALKQLGLDIEAIDKLSPADQFEKIADAIGDIPNPRDKVQAIADVFGKSGFDLSRMFQDGSQSITDATNAIDRMNGGLSELDIASVNALDGSWKELNATIDAQWNRLVADLAPAVTVLLEDTIAWLQEASTQETLTELLTDVESIFTDIASIVDALIPTIDVMSKSLLSGLNAAAPYVKLLQNARELLGGAAAQPEQSFSAKTNAKAEQFNADRINREFERELDKEIRLRNADEGGTKLKKKTISDVSNALDELKSPAEKAADAIAKWQDAMFAGALSEPEFIKLRDFEFKKLNKQADKAFDDLFKADLEKRKQTESVLDALKSPLQKATDAIKKWHDAMLDGVISEQEFNILKDAEKKKISDRVTKPERNALTPTLDTITVGSHAYFEALSSMQRTPSPVNFRMPGVADMRFQKPEAEKQTDILKNIDKGIQKLDLTFDVQEVTL